MNNESKHAFMIINHPTLTGYIKETDYFETDSAKDGIIFMSNMQSTLRLMIPQKAFAQVKKETKHAKRMEMEIHDDRVLLFFYDKQPQPFAIQISIECVDFLPPVGRKPKLHIYTEEAGKIKLYKSLDAIVVGTQSKTEWNAGSVFTK